MNATDTIGCEEALRQLLTYLDGELADPDRQRVDQHLKRCRSCWSRSEFERRLKAQLAALGRVPPRPQLEDRIRSLVTGLDSTGG